MGAWRVYVGTYMYLFVISYLVKYYVIYKCSVENNTIINVTLINS